MSLQTDAMKNAVKKIGNGRFDWRECFARRTCWSRPQRRNRIADRLMCKGPLAWSSYGFPRLCPDCSVFTRTLRPVPFVCSVHGVHRHPPVGVAKTGETSSSGFGPSLPRSRRGSLRMTAASVTSRPNSRR